MLIVLGFIAFACKKDPVGQQPIDSVPPGPISNVKVVNTSGGAIFTYSLPQDEDLLYVKAVYSLKDGVSSETRSSLYKDTLRVEGFGDTLERQVKLIAVDRSRNESPAVVLTIKPLVSAVNTIGTTLKLIEDFGGVCLFWKNPTKAEVSVVMLMEDKNKEFVPIKTFYSSMADGGGAQHGLDTIPRKFGVYVQDRWGNRSDIKYLTLTPLYETKFDRLKFLPVLLPTDAPDSYNFQFENFWNGITLEWGGIHSPAGMGFWPASFTMDMGITAKISRIKIWQFPDYGLFAHGNMKKFEIWGCTTLNPTGNWAGWTKLMNCISIKPSGLPLGTISNEDKALCIAGEEWTNSPANPKVRYIRIRCTESWAGGDFMCATEIQIFGDNR